MDTDTSQDARGKRRWVILAASFFSLLLTGFSQYNAGVMKVALIRHWGSDVFTTTWLASYVCGCYAFTAPVGCVLINLVNCRACVVLSGVLCLVGYALSSLVTHVSHLFFTLTLVGIGQGMSNSGSLVILGYYFPDKANIVTGVSIAGGALGMFVHPSLLQAFVDWYGLRGAFLLSGAVAFHSCVCGALMRPARIERRAARSKRQGNTVQRVCHVISDACSGHTTLLTSWSMLMVLLSVFFFSLCVHGLLVQLPAYLISYSGLTPTQAAFSISMSGIGSFFSRLLSGFIAHEPKIGNRLVYCGLMGVHVLVSLSAPSLLTEGAVGAYIYLFMVGLYSGGCFPLFITIMYDVVSLHHFSTAFGLSHLVIGIGTLVGAPLSELLGDSPYMLFGFVAALFFASTVFGSLVTITATSKTSSEPSLPEKQPLDSVVHAAAVEAGDDDSGKIPEHEKLLSGSLTAAHTREDSPGPTQEEIQLSVVRTNGADQQEAATAVAMDSSSPLLERTDGEISEQFPQNVKTP